MFLNCRFLQFVSIPESRISSMNYHLTNPINFPSLFSIYKSLNVEEGQINALTPSQKTTDFQSSCSTDALISDFQVKLIMKSHSMHEMTTFEHLQNPGAR
ncbi:hypothetical protein R6Q59_005994 [Mikania micrantha]